MSFESGRLTSEDGYKLTEVLGCALHFQTCTAQQIYDELAFEHPKYLLDLNLIITILNSELAKPFIISLDNGLFRIQNTNSLKAWLTAFGTLCTLPGISEEVRLKSMSRCHEAFTGQRL